VRSLRTVQLLTLAYWLGAVGWALLSGRPDEFALNFIGTSVFFAIPLTIAVWAIWAATKYFRIGLGPIAFAIAGVILAGLDIRGFIYYEHWSPLHYAQKSRERFLTTKLDWIRDEPIMTHNGPIGVRIQYRVTYAVAEPICESQVHAGDLTLGKPVSLFDRTASLVSPSISAVCPAGSYEFTADFMPVFIPGFLANSSVVANAKSRCMRWRADLPSKEVVLSTDAQRLDFSMIFRGTAIHQNTQNTYTLADFYKTALASGGIDCAENTK
jgi:hypothetical protein